MHSLRPIAARQMPACEFDAELIRRLDRSGPRYTSYPTADRFADTYTATDYIGWVSHRSPAGGQTRPLSLYTCTCRFAAPSASTVAATRW